MKVFLDTNILIDLVCSIEGFLEDAECIFQLGYEGKFKISICALSFINTYYTGRKYKLDSLELHNALEGICSFCEVTPINETIVKQALTFKLKDFEDVVQFCSAKESNSDIIVTRNAKDFSQSTIPVLTPKEFLTNVLDWL